MMKQRAKVRGVASGAVSVLLFLLTFSGLANALEVEDIKVTLWVPGHHQELLGEYEAIEEFNGSSTLHIRAYHDKSSEGMQFLVCMIFANDLVVKPKIKSWYGIKLIKGVLTRKGTKSVTFVPIIVDGKLKGIRFGERYFLKAPDVPGVG